MNAWSHLSNAHHIDWMLASLKSNSAMWDRAWTAARRAPWEAAWSAARIAAWDRAWKAARASTRCATWYAAWDAAYDAVRGETRVAAANVILALIAYDDCDQYLNMTHEQLLIHAILSDKPQAVLLLPMKLVQEHERLVTAS